MAVLATALSLEAAVRFDASRDFPDLGLSLPTLAGARADVAKMPVAEFWLAVDGAGRPRLEDRYDVFDLWRAETVRATWRDAAGNVLSLARLDACVPDDAPDAKGRTRTDFHARQQKRPLGVKDGDARGDAVYLVAPAETGAPEKPRRAQRRNFLALLDYPTTNAHVRVCAFRPRCRDRKATPPWFVASFVAAPGDDAEEVLTRFDEDFLDNVTALDDFPPEKLPADEKALLFRAVRRNVANYPEWCVVESGDVILAEDLRTPDRDAFVAAFTNDLPRFRRVFAKAFPSPLAGAAHPAVARCYDAREDYLAYVGADYAWTAAVWSAERRELVLHYPVGGAEELLRTARHEAFHQYLDYAAALVQAAPWLNEGHAELFENAHLDSRGEVVYEVPPENEQFVQSDVDRLAEALPALLRMDYEGFYAGSAEEKRAKYALAWSLAYFFEVGAPKVRFRPFENLRADYVKALVETRRRADANRLVFTDAVVANLVAEWRAFWKRR